MMEGLWQLLIVGCVCHFLSSPCVFGAKIIGTPAECRVADFVPGHNLAGEGLDIVTMKRMGAYVIDLESWKRKNGTCTLVKNAHLGGKREKLPIAVVDWRNSFNCKMKVTSKRYESSESLVRDATSSVENSWKVGLSIPFIAGVSYGGTHSEEAAFAMAKSKEDKYTFTSQGVHCDLYRYRLAAQPKLHEEFEDAIGRLPKTYSESAYMDLIHTYGTHYITRVQLGGRLKDTTAIRTCKAAIKSLTTTQIMDCLEVEASGKFKSFRLEVERRTCQKIKRKLGGGQTFSSTFNERYSEIVGGHHASNLFFSRNSHAYQSWMNSLKTKPGIVLYRAKPLFFLLKTRDPARLLLNKAISNYIGKNALLKKCSESCKIGWRKNVRDRCDCVCNSNSWITANCCPAKPGLATLTVYGLYARKLYGDWITQTDGSVLVTYGTKSYRTRIIANNDNPNWPEVFYFGRIEINMATMLRFDVYDEDSRWNSDHLGQCSVTLRRGTVSRSCTLNHGTLFFSYRVKCAPNLGGDRCQDYVDSPMSPSQAKRFHSRNGILAGEHWEALLTGNHSEFVERGSGFEDHSGE